MNPMLFSGILAFGSAPVENAELSIAASDLLAHVFFLSGDALRGREAGSAEEKIAAAYLAQTLACHGVPPIPSQESYFQDFDPEEGDEEVRMRNVAAWIEGTDPLLREEYVILGAHYDHVGMGHEGSLEGEIGIHNGADDNGSGTAALLELAQAFRLAPPKRSILFLFFSGEEKGLWGSKMYCEEPLLPLSRAVAMINLDMVGRSRDRYLFAGGVGTGKGFLELVRKHAAADLFDLETGSGGMAPSDNSNFFLKKMPVLFFFTHVHDDYHATGDDWWKLDYESHEKIARLVYRVAREIADAPERPKFQNDPGIAVPSDFMQRMTAIMQKRGIVPKPKKR